MRCRRRRRRRRREDGRERERSQREKGKAAATIMNPLAALVWPAKNLRPPKSKKWYKEINKGEDSTGPAGNLGLLSDR